MSGDTGNLEDTFPKIQSYFRNLHGWAPLLTEDDFCRLPQSETDGVDAIHPIRVV